MTLPSVSAVLEDAQTRGADVRPRAVSLQAAVSGCWPLWICVSTAT